MKEQFVPIKVWKEQDCDLWHLDVSNLNLSELIELRNDLLGCHDISVRVLDGILYQEYKNNDTYVQRCKKESKEENLETGYKTTYMINKGTENNVSEKFGFNLKTVFGINSPVNNIRIVEIID